MKTYSYNLSDKKGRPISFDLTAESAQYLYEELQHDLGHDKPVLKPAEEKINFTPLPDLQKVQTSKSETELYYGSYTGRLFKRSRALGDEGKTWVFSNVENRWENDMTNLYDYELLNGSFTVLTEV